MENLCNNCIHKDVCSRWTATWGMKTCEHFKEERKGEWEYIGDADVDDNLQAYCSYCGAGDTHATSMVGKIPYCWKCGADMRGTEDG